MTAPWEITWGVNSENSPMSGMLKSGGSFTRSLKPRQRRFFLLAAIGSSNIVTSLLILKFAPAPFFWIDLSWATALWIGTLGFTGSWSRAVLLNLGVVACMLAAAEAYLTNHEYTPTIFSNGFMIHDNVLGWAPTKGMQAHAFKAGPAGIFHAPEGVLFDVNYTIDDEGLRIAPSYRKDQLDGTALFFGCSFAFGEGLKDNETMPYQVGVLSEGRFRTLNFAFEAYGPNQMLAAIENGIVQRVVDTTPRYAYYIAIPAHVWRVAGKVSWGGDAPRYVRDADDKVQLAGHFENGKPLAERLGLRHGVGQLQKSAIWRMLESPDHPVTDDDVRLYFAVVRRSHELLEAMYPGIQFRVILWPNQHVAQQRATYEKLREGFRQMGIPVDLVEDILPGYSIDRSPYILGSADHHPNALANRLIAEHVVQEILH